MAILLLTGAGTASGAVVGLLAAFIATPLPDSAVALAIPVIGAGLVLDTLVLIVGNPTPPGSGRQVPQEWSRFFSARVVAVLYGARLGVGPLTILSTWTWWSVTIAAVLTGPMASVAVGACFGLVRLLATVGASLLSSRQGIVRSRPNPQLDSHRDSGETPSVIRQTTPRHAEWFGRLRALQRPNWIVLNGIGIFALSMFLLAGCGSPTPEVEDSAPVSEQAATEDSQNTGSDPSANTEAGSKSEAETEIAAGFEAGRDAGAVTEQAMVDESLITPVELEDVVRTAIEKQLTPAGDMSQPGASDDGSPEAGQPTPDAGAVTAADAPVLSTPTALAKALMSSIDGFQPVDDPKANRFLNLTDAADIQPDPTEEIALLETRGFEGGWTRAFRNEHNDVAVTSVYQFRDAAEAEFYLEDGLITIGGYGGKFFELDDLPGVRGFVQYFTETDAGGSEELVSLGAAFQAGPRWYLVYFVGSVDTVTPDVLIPAVTAQLEVA